MCKEKCGVTVSFKNGLGFHAGYYRCENEVKYSVEYKSGTNGELNREKLCGVHFNALKKRVERVKKRTGWDSNLVYEHLSQLK